MNKVSIVATDFQRKPYAEPQIKVVEIKGADMICTSGETEKLEEEEFDW